ncbi:MAG: D-alanyl-D-alanine carboxypeptidase [Chlamydiae bacterium]|nr:D-alanyl-D-alanine carboxypeptidase [Chlamydiota bacterium]
MLKYIVKSRFLWPWIAGLLISPSAVFSRPLKCEISAPYAILINADTGRILYEKNARVPTCPASTTKIGTALYSLHLKGDRLEDRVIISANAVATVAPSLRRGGKHPSYRLEVGGSHMNLKPGESIPFNTLLYGLLVSSSNDAANAIAEYTSGSVAEFMQGMNRYLRSIGCEHTHFQNPHGLPDPDHVTTAYDLAQIALFAMKHPFFSNAVQLKRYVRPKTNKQEESVLLQSNALLKQGKFFYPYAIGIKTGYTVAAGSNLVAAAENGGRKVIAVVLNCTDSTQRYRSCIDLFEAAFNEVKVERKLFSKEYDSFFCILDGATSRLEGVLLRDISLEYYPSEASELSATCHWYKKELPIKKGDQVGEIQVMNASGKCLLTEAVLAKNHVEPTISYQFMSSATDVLFFVKKHKQYIGAILGLAVLLISYSRFRQKGKITG